MLNRITLAIFVLLFLYPAYAQQNNAFENCGNGFLVCRKSTDFQNMIAAAQAGNIAGVDAIARTCRCHYGRLMVKGAWIPAGLGCYTTAIQGGGYTVWGAYQDRPGVCP